MAKVLRVYNDNTLIAEQPSPVTLIELEPETKYNLKCSFYDEGKESEKVDVPEFTTGVATVDNNPPDD